MILGLSGSRSLTDPVLVFSWLERAWVEYRLPEPPDSAIHGGAPGFDTLADEWLRSAFADEFIPSVIRPDYQKYHPKRAPLERNTLIVRESTHMLFMGDGMTRGTMDTFNKAIKMGRPSLFINTIERKIYPYDWP